MGPETKENGVVASATDALPGPPSDLPKSARADIWGEVIAVLAIGVFPHLSAAIFLLYWPPSRAPYWLDSFDLSFRSVCIIFAVLYLIHRSGESFANFGLRRPQRIDILLGLCLLGCSEWLWGVQCRIFSTDVANAGEFFPPPRQAVDYLLMAMKYAANVFAEELVTRAYLITRFEFLLQSKPKAVMAAAMLFASYHVYYGVSSLGYFFVLAIVFGVVFLLTRRIWPVTLGHFLMDIRADLAIAE